MPLNEYEPTEIVGVTRQHIQEILSVLNWAYLYHSGVDMSERARNGQAEAKASAITVRIERAYNHLEGYIADVNVPQE